MKIALPFGTWTSPISADLIVSKTIGFGTIVTDGDDIYWIETRPQEGGRHVVVKDAANGSIVDITPAAFNARTRVHEYGGGAYGAYGGIIYFANYSDQRIYKQKNGEAPEPVTVEAEIECGYRFADIIVDNARNRLIAVLEDHTVTMDAKMEPANSIVAIALDGSGKMTTLACGADFYSSAKLSHDNQKLAWLTWNHPNMPWDGSELYAGNFDQTGMLINQERLAGGPDESIFQPEWSDDDQLYFVSDRSDWWNLYRLKISDAKTKDLGRGAPCVPADMNTSFETEALCDMEAEFGKPQWIFGESTYAFCSSDSLICTFNRKGIWHLAKIDLKNKKFSEIPTEYTDIKWLKASKDKIVFCAASPTKLPAIVVFDPENDKTTELKTASDISFDLETISRPKIIEFPTKGGLISYGFYYPPGNADCKGPANERPPLLVKSHGGPTGSTSTWLNLSIQYWTSRGFAVVDVNYGGSTGYGRQYRQRLYGQWGIVDVDDCVNAALYLAKEGLVDGKRLLISGGSAGGYTTLCALTFRDAFAAGASYYGIGDLLALCHDTHKFESRTSDRLVAPYPQETETYLARSPVYHIDQLKRPVIFFQGLEDKVVPPNQAESMVEALRHRHLPVAYLAFPGEQHGFRNAKTIKRCLESELYFYSRILGFQLSEPIEPISIENL